MIQLAILLGIAGAAGTLCRYGMVGLVQYLFGAGDSWIGTLAVNIIGSFIVGFVWVLSEERSLIHMQTRIVILAGFTGAFTTFSTLMFDTGKMIEQSEFLLAGLNLFGQCAAGILIFYLGCVVARAI